MSDVESKQQAVRFEPVVDRAAAAPGVGSLILGVVWPAVVIAVELATHMCAEAVLDPMPTWWHVLAVALVPVVNLLLWLRLRRPPDADSGVRSADRWLVLASGAATAIAGFYALIFLPMLPIALIAVIWAGIGLLPMGPLAGFVAVIRLGWRLRAGLAPMRVGRLLGSGVAAGLALLLLLDVPAAATRLGLQWASSSQTSERERGLALLRTLGDHDLLLRLCYDRVGRPAGLVSALVMVIGNGLLEPERLQIVQSPAEVREIYYRVTGKAFNAQPPPFRKASWRDDFAFDADHGGTEIGGRIKGLDMVASRMDASLAGNDAVAYIEWVLELRNTSLLDREARLQIALPPGGVVSRATLWVNGEEKDGAYGGRGEVRAAYRKVAVMQRRDPLLVTSKGADRVLVQAFPVGRGGGTIKLKIGITAPLDLIEGGKARLTLPAIFDRNFSFPDDVSHSVWVESRQPLAGTAKGLAASRTGDGVFRLAGTLTDAELAGVRPTLTVERDAHAGAVLARLDDGEAVLQEVVSAAPKAGALMLVVDGSRRMRAVAPQLAAALRMLPPTARVGLIVAGAPIRRIALAAATDAHKEHLARLIGEVDYVGGQDNGPALAEALLALEAEPDAKLLWVHGPQPIPFRRSAPQIEQATERLQRLPEIFLYAVEPGPNEVLPDTPWGWSARLLPRIASPKADLAAFFEDELGGAPRPTLRRASVKAGEVAEGTRQGSDHIARLWAKARIDAILRDKAGNRADAAALAVRYRLVTPVSGVVVLESQQQYDDSRLTPVSPQTVPTVPEPHEWALLLVAGALLAGWLAWHHRRRRARVQMVPA